MKTNNHLLLGDMQALYYHQTMGDIMSSEYYKRVVDHLASCVHCPKRYVFDKKYEMYTDTLPDVIDAFYECNYQVMKKIRDENLSVPNIITTESVYNFSRECHAKYPALADRLRETGEFILIFIPNIDTLKDGLQRYVSFRVMEDINPYDDGTESHP
jgi:hypothetical protein